jgi:hypothetical protein
MLIAGLDVGVVRVDLLDRLRQPTSATPLHGAFSIVRMRLK